MGLSYELIKFAGRHDNPVTRVISAPGLWLQRLTTAEPDDSMIEVAIASCRRCCPKRERMTVGSGGGLPGPPGDALRQAGIEDAGL